ncbi:PilZ domain-containing protein [Sneathiella chinensis]|uniref:PilZ domain-containing protein n=1 Tax=Sneathiella chinensis TaxID=349750 RepID=A0ABQ5U241_9PROT|nr:PilZ domain-containing protein [Sneathiella chinensis]GLQ05412.1 hypothetical protein GCM10007924_06330 [Sneathiella chinensis]
MTIGPDIKGLLDELEARQAAVEAAATDTAPYSENRRYRRSRVVWEARLKMSLQDVTLRSRITEVKGVVRDVSANGARVDLFGELDLEADLEMILPSIATFPCKAVWAKGQQVGLQFKDSPDQVYQAISRVFTGFK